MTPSERRNLRKWIVSLTESGDHRAARVAEHLHRALESIELATREESDDDTTTQQGLGRARQDVYRDVRSVLDVLESQRRRRAPQTLGTAPQTATVKP